MDRYILIAPSSFAERDATPLERLRSAGFGIIDNPQKRRLTREELVAIYGGAVPDDVEILPSAPKGSMAGAFIAVKRDAQVRGEDLIDAKQGTDRFGKPGIDFTLSASAGETISPMASVAIDT